MSQRGVIDKDVTSRQPPTSNQHKNAREQNLNCKANIYFNTGTIERSIIPQYAKIKFLLPLRPKNLRNKSPRTFFKDEIKYHCISKTNFIPQMCNIY